MTTPRLVCCLILLAALLGVAACDFAAGNYKTAAIGCLFTAANVLIFFFP